MNAVQVVENLLVEGSQFIVQPNDPVKNIVVNLLYDFFQRVAQFLVDEVAQCGIAGSLHPVPQPHKPNIHFAQLFYLS